LIPFGTEATFPDVGMAEISELRFDAVLLRIVDFRLELTRRFHSNLTRLIVA
jgi:hypothetical protein